MKYNFPLLLQCACSPHIDTGTFSESYLVTLFYIVVIPIDSPPRLTFQCLESIFVGSIFYAEQQTGMRNEILSFVSDTFRLDREKGTSDCVYSEVRV